MIKTTFKSIGAGLAISIGGLAYLLTGNPFVFPIGLLMVCFFKFYLFTGKVCYARKKDIIPLIYIWLINILTAFTIGLLCRAAYPQIIETVIHMVNIKMSSYGWVILKAILCNIMIFTAVEIWRVGYGFIKVAGLIFATAVFIMCGFEHCIANAFYFGCALALSVKSILFIIINTIFNAVGGWCFAKMVMYKGR